MQHLREKNASSYSPIDIVVGFPDEDIRQVVSQCSHRRPKIEVKIRPLRVPAALAPVLGRRGLGRRDGGLLRGAEQEQETEVARGCGLRRAGPGAVDLAAAVAWQGELGLEEGARGQLAGRRGELGKEERHGFLLLALQFFWSPLLRLRASVSHGEASKSHWGCVRVCCEEEGDLSGSESCSKPVGGKIAIVVSLVSDVV